MHEAKMIEGIEGDVLPRVIEKIIKNGRIICFDEFQVCLFKNIIVCFVFFFDFVWLFLQCLSKVDKGFLDSLTLHPSYSHHLPPF